MRVRMRTAMAGPKLTAQAGAVVEIDDATAEEWIKGGYAEEAKEKAAAKPEAPKSETTATKPAETATSGPQRKPKG